MGLQVGLNMGTKAETTRKGGRKGRLIIARRPARAYCSAMSGHRKRELKEFDIRVPVTPSFKKIWDDFAKEEGESGAALARTALKEYMERRAATRHISEETLDGAEGRG